MGDELDLSGVKLDESDPEKNLVYGVDDRSDYSKVKSDIFEKLFVQGDSEPMTTKEILYSVPAGVKGVVNVAGDVVKGFVVGGVVGTVKAFTVDLDQTLQGVTDIVSGKTKLSQVGDALTASLYADPAYFAGEVAFAVSAPTIIGKTVDKIGAVRAVTSGKFAPVVLTESGEVISGVARSGSINARTISVTAGGIVDKTPATTFNIPVAGGVSSTAESLVEQAKLAGTTADAVSGQRSLFNVFKKELKINKPKPTPQSSPLEEMFFSDPRGRIRTSRLGLTAEDVSSELSFSELLKNPSKLFERPQIVVQENVKIANFPPELQGVKSKLLAGESLTASESADLLTFQQTVTGEFKTPGFLFRESEITLAKGEVLVKEGTQAVTIIKGKRVPIISTTIKPVDAVASSDVVLASAGDVVTSSGAVGSSSSSAGKIVGSSTFRPVQVASSSANLARSSFIVSGGSGSSVFISEPSVVSGGSSSGSSLVKPSYIVKSKTFSSSSIISPLPSVVSVSPSRGSRSSKSSGSSNISAPVSVIVPSSNIVKPSSSVSGGSSGFSSGGSSSPSSPIPPYGSSYFSPIPKPFQRSRQRAPQGFDVFVRTRGVFQKVSKSALGRSDARDFGAYNVANTPQATFTLRPSSSRVGTVSSKVKGSFFAFQSNFQKKGDLFIEKRGKRIKSGGEKAGITRLGILANKNKSIFKKVKL
jgi:hypothetical protein